MARCETCGNDYSRPITVTRDGATHTCTIPSSAQFTRWRQPASAAASEYSVTACRAQISSIAARIVRAAPAPPA